jgi:orotate phosphoribosyltransferase
MTRRDEIRSKALADLQHYEVLMLKGHFDFGNGYHGEVYLNPHQLFRYPSTIWRFAQDLLDVLPASVVDATEVVTGPVTGGALLAHTIAGLLDSRRAITRPPTLFAPLTLAVDCAARSRSPLGGSGGAPSASRDTGGHEREAKGHTLTQFYRKQVAGRKALLVDDVRNTGQTQAHCVEVVRDAGGEVLASAEIYDRLEAVVDAGVPNFALAEYKAPENYPAEACPMCRRSVPVTRF